MTDFEFIDTDQFEWVDTTDHEFIDSQSNIKLLGFIGHTAVESATIQRVVESATIQRSL
jgi:hypothetical protein